MAPLSFEDEIRNAALRYCSLGWRVIPIFGISEKGLCHCKNLECKAPGKHPALPDWVNRASSDPAIVSNWEWKNRNIGIATGEKSNLLVVDIDVDKDGDMHLREWERTHNVILETELRVITGSGGYHYYFRYPSDFDLGDLKNSVGKIQGVDIRVNGGQVVAPPSRHKSGRNYEWEV